jgi:glutamate N-acetyltransferase/amino-acid N-acetyltransferase
VHLRPDRRRRLHVHQRHRAAAGQRRLRRAADAEELTAAVTAVCHDLAQQLIATPRAPPSTSSSRCWARPSEADAVEVGPCVARNNLVKTALFGNDPNWGRILAAVGTTAPRSSPTASTCASTACGCAGAVPRRGPVQGGPARRDVTITVHLHEGEMAATIWTTDLSHAYVHENSAYSS